MIEASTRPLVVLDRVADVELPDYCTHGKATCVACGEWVWLGSETYGTVASRAADPLCMPCARKHVPPDHRPSGNIRDHRRADGPHHDPTQSVP